MTVKKKHFESFFKKVEKDIIFVYKGRSSMTFTKYNDTSATDTRVKLISGLNHFLRFVYDFRPEEDIEYVNEYIVRTYLACINDATAINNSKEYAKDVKRILVKHCNISDERFLEIVAAYVDKTTVMSIEEDKATTDITLLNKHAKALNIISLLIKFTFLISSLLRCDMTYNETLLLYMDPLSLNAFRAFLKNAEEDYSDHAVDTLATEIDEFLIKSVTKLWNDHATKKSYVDKFKSIGIDSMTAAKKNKMDVYSSFKKYIPVCVSHEVAKNYSSSETAMLELYWTHDKAFEDFKNITINLASWTQKTLQNVILTQDLNKQFSQDINVTSILVNSNEENSLRRENSLYEDKEGHLLEIRQTSGKALFKMIIEEIEQYEFDIRKETPHFNIEHNHPFNQFILAKILLSLTGEHRVYKEFYGNFSKVFLALFYIKIKDSDEFNFISNEIEIMKCNGKPNTEIYKLQNIENFLEEVELKVDPVLFKSILGVYSNNNGDNFILEARQFYKLFKFLESPARVRSMLFPDRYKPIDEDRGDLSKYTIVNLKFAEKVRESIVGGIYD